MINTYVQRPAGITDAQWEEFCSYRSSAIAAGARPHTIESWEKAGFLRKKSVAYYTPGGNATHITLRREKNYDPNNHGNGDIKDITISVEELFNLIDKGEDDV